MTDVNKLITDNINVWTSAIKKRSKQGRGSSKKIELTGVKKLRRLILELAVRGKLVPQDVNDEPASVLLEQIAEEKVQLIANKIIKKTKPLSAIVDKEKPFVLPNSWMWCRFGDLAQHNSGKTLDKGRNSGTPKPYLTTSNLYWGKFRLDNVKEMLIEDEQLEKCTAILGDLLICEGGEAGRAAVWQQSYDVCFQNHIHRARFYSDVNPYYMYRFFEYLTATGLIDNYRKGVGISNMSGKSLASIITILPPLAEQHRIVAKIDELMALCDQLEQQTEESLSAHQTLVEVLLAALTNCDSTEDFQTSWQRIAEHFDVLFTTELSIEKLKQTILQLAVMGKLVPQNPSDEPASVLLEKIAEEKVQLIADKKIKKQKPLSAITDEENPFELPNSWEWARFDQIIDQQYPISYGVLVPGPQVDDGIPLVRIGDISLYSAPIKPEKSIDKNIDAKYERTRLEGGEILLAVVGATIGKLGLVPNTWKGANIARALCRIKPVEYFSTSFVLLLLQSKFMQENFIGDTRTVAQPTLNIASIKNALTPLPPLAEQHRIVARVDELMALCEQLKARLSDAQTTQLHLADAVVENALKDQPNDYGKNNIIFTEDEAINARKILKNKLNIGL